MQPSSVRRRAALAGVGVAVFYVVAAAVSGSLSPLARRALLDGVHNAPPYNWVSQPPDEQGSGQPPRELSERIEVAAQGNEQTILTTGDDQVSVNLPAGAIPAQEGRKTAELKIEPLDPADYATALEGYAFRGNVYRIIFREVPGGAGIATLAEPGTLTMVYASPAPDLLNATYDIAYSADGNNWRLLAAQDQHATQRISAPLVDIGYYAPVAKIPDDEPDKDAGGSSFPWIVLIVIVVAAGAAFVMTVRLRRAREAARRKAEIREQLARRSRSTKKRRR